MTSPGPHRQPVRPRLRPKTNRPTADYCNCAGRLPQPCRRREVAVHPEERAGGEDPRKAGGACPAEEGTWPQVCRRGGSKTQGALSLWATRPETSTNRHKHSPGPFSRLVYTLARVALPGLCMLLGGPLGGYFVGSCSGVFPRSSPPKSPALMPPCTAVHGSMFGTSGKVKFPFTFPFSCRGRGWNPHPPTPTEYNIHALRSFL